MGEPITGTSQSALADLGGNRDGILSMFLFFPAVGGGGGDEGLIVFTLRKICCRLYTERIAQLHSRRPEIRSDQED